eukprot:CAMPEP_0174241976 /NCGR_PEP_ID=MMETSP0417-20130205/25850_1 /TAXON_ID=242541 /ORGANISM="Mayorella sp, Strain BSH-02190019" /LENGTH=293 /DNA_ID=CAMNT_0015321315 /DNA_START=96 /DNA_END=977 /DNA_ORIENTATION=+
MSKKSTATTTKGNATINMSRDTLRERLITSELWQRKVARLCAQLATYSAASDSENSSRSEDKVTTAAKQNTDGDSNAEPKSPAQQLRETAEGVLFELQSFSLTVERNARAEAQRRREIRLLRELAASAEAETAAAERECEELRAQLETTRQQRTEHEQTEMLSRQVKTLPSRAHSLAELQALSVQLDEVSARRTVLERRLRARQQKVQLLFEVLAEFEHELADEERLDSKSSPQQQDEDMSDAVSGDAGGGLDGSAASKPSVLGKRSSSTVSSSSDGDSKPRLRSRSKRVALG